MDTTTQTATPDAGTTQTGADETKTGEPATGATGGTQSTATPAKTPDPIAGRMKAIQNKHRRQTAELLERIAALEAAAGTTTDDDEDDTKASAPATTAIKPDAAATAAADAAAARLEQKLKNRDKELALAKGAQTSLRNKLAETQCAAYAAGTADPGLVAKLAMETIRVTDAGETEVLDAKGEIRYSDVTGEPMTAQELIAEILVAKPYLAGGQPRTGVPGGITPAPGSTTAATIDTKIKAAVVAKDFKLANALRMQKAVALGRAHLDKITA